MGINVDGYTIEDTQISGIALTQMIGGYELIFHLHLQIREDSDENRRASIIGAQVNVKSNEGGALKLGFSRPEQPFDIVCKPFSTSSSHNLHLQLQPAQLAALEELRGADDLDFELQVSGTGTGKNGRVSCAAKWSTRISRSDWIEKLRLAGAQNILLLEVPLPLETDSESQPGWASELQRADRQFRNGEYKECISLCRTVLTELGKRRYGKNNWYTSVLKRLASDLNGMNKDERESALFAALRHYTHQAHHSLSEGGVLGYTRAEAQFVLILTSTAAARLRE